MGRRRPSGLKSLVAREFCDNRHKAMPALTAPVLFRDRPRGMQVLLGGVIPAVVGAIGMLAGFCGTLMTPMAANFNLVPAALLDLKDQYGVIRAQVATALPLLIVNLLLIYGFAFR